MIYCQHCGKKNAEESEACAFCGEHLDRELPEGNERPLVQKLHQAENVARDKVDIAMSFIVLGLIFITLGIVFFVLSFKLPNTTAQSKVLTVTCFEFWVSMVGLVGGAAGLIYGLIVLIKNKMALKTLKADIETIRETKTPIV